MGLHKTWGQTSLKLEVIRSESMVRLQGQALRASSTLEEFKGAIRPYADCRGPSVFLPHPRGTSEGTL